MSNLVERSRRDRTATPLGLRDRAMLETLDPPLKVCELVALKLRVNLDARVPCWQGVEGRLVPLGEERGPISQY